MVSPSRAATSPPDAASPYVFVVGCPRSGTTLLQRILDAHPQLAVANDTHFIPRAVAKVAGGSIRRASATTGKEALVDWTRNYHRFPRLGLHADLVDRADAASETFPGFVGELYRALAEQHGKRYAGEKTPDYIRHIALLNALFPESRTVHIIRDGRDVALSLLDWAHERKGPGRLDLWREEPVAACALWWSWQVEGQDQARRLPRQSYLEIKYEDLVADPLRTMRSVTDRLELPFTEEMLRFNRGKSRRAPGLSAKKAWLSPTPGLRDWRTQLDSRSLALFEALAGDRLKKNGYPLAIEKISASISVLADDCRSWWESRRGPHRMKRGSALRRPAGAVESTR